MKLKPAQLSFPVIIMLLLAMVAASFSRKKELNPVSNIAVVELFTSEGCSSCPAADIALAKIAAENKENLLMLAYHVDYWNRLGWTDKFSRAEFSARQAAYAKKFGLQSVYTPQAVVNGTVELLGSDEKKIRALIEKQNEPGVSKPCQARAMMKNPSTVSVSFTAAGNADQLINFALVQLKGSSMVTAGENKGRELSHVDIVREIKTLAGNSGSVDFHIPDGLSPKEFRLVSFLQDKKSLQISGAAVVRLEV